MRLFPECKAVVYFPYRGKQSWVAAVSDLLNAFAQAHRGAGEGSANPSVPVAAAAQAANDQVRKRAQVTACLPAGQVWGLRVEPIAPPSAVALQNLTAEVTVNLRGNIAPPPPGAEGPLPGNGRAVRGEALTDPAPPVPVGLEQWTFPGNGTAIVNLGKGWKWTISGTPTPMGYMAPAPVVAEVPNHSTVTLRSTLAGLLSLKVTTGTTPAHCQREQLVGGNWVFVAEGDTSPVDGVETWSSGMPIAPGHYRVRARRRMGPPPLTYSDWVTFEVTPALEKVVPVAAP